MSSPKKRTRADANRLARRRGADFEKRVAERLGGRRYPGEEGDVEARGVRLECKFRMGKFIEEIPNTELAGFFAQIRRYQENNPEIPFLFAYSGGRSAGNEVWVAMPIEHFVEMDDQIENARLLREFRDKHPDRYERIVLLLEEIVRDLREEGPRPHPD